MRIIKLSKFDIANGLGIGLVIWCSGCEHKCPGCHNPETWDFNQGDHPDHYMAEILEFLDNPHIKRVTFSGGDPLDPKNQWGLTRLAKIVKGTHPDKKIWVYTGDLWENVASLPVMEYIDVLVDGPFIESQKDISLAWCGSRNQRVIDVQESRRLGEIVLVP